MEKLYEGKRQFVSLVNYKRLFLEDFLQIRLSVLQYVYLSVYIYI